MKPTGIKLVFEFTDGRIATWHDTFNSTVGETINNLYGMRNISKAKIIECYLEFDNDGEYYKVFIDVDKNKLNQFLGQQENVIKKRKPAAKQSGIKHIIWHKTRSKWMVRCGRKCIRYYSDLKEAKKVLENYQKEERVKKSFGI